MDRPTIVCLCGSTRFFEAFQAANFRETMAGKIVLSVGFFGGSIHGETVGITLEDKARLDELHLRKIDLADEVLILNVGGYIGESTGREWVYAKEHGKPVRFLEPNAPIVLPGDSAPLPTVPCKDCGTPLLPNAEKWWGLDGPYCREHYNAVQEEFSRMQAGVVSKPKGSSLVPAGYDNPDNNAWTRANLGLPPEQGDPVE